MKKIYNFFNRIPIGILGGILSGIFYLILFGADELIVTNTDWLMDIGKVGDKGLAYLGTLFYIFSDWQFPIGLSDQLSYPLSYSVVYIDSVPLAALISKLILPVIGRTDFQYLGIISLLNQILMGGISSIFITKITKSKCAGLIATFYFIINFPYLSRIFVHFGLQAQWLLVALLYFFILDKDKNLKVKTKIIFYFLFGTLTVWIHSYFLPPMLISIVFVEISNIHSKKNILHYSEYIISYMVACLTSLYILGGTYGNVIYDTGIIGQQGSNLNTFFNPCFTSKFLPKLPLYASGQHNGSVYLGAGVFLLIAFIIIASMVAHKGKIFQSILENMKRYWNIILGMIAIFVFALSPTITLNDKLLFKLPLPDFLVHLWGVFRATGRAAWMILYIILAFSIYQLFKLFKRNIAIIILFVCICLQIFDYSDKIHALTAERGVKNDVGYESILENPAWSQLEQMNKDKIIFMNGANRNNSIKLINIIGVQRVYEIARFAFQNNMSVNDFYFARTNQDIGDYRSQLWGQLDKNIIDEKAIYIFVENPVKLIQNRVLNFYLVDGYLIGLREELQGCQKIEPNDELSIMPLLATYLKNGQYVDGERVLFPEGTSNGPDIPLNAGQYILTITGSDLDNIQLEISADNQCQVNYSSYSNEMITADIYLEKNIEHFIVAFSNVGHDNSSIKDVTIKKIK